MSVSNKGSDANPPIPVEDNSDAWSDLTLDDDELRQVLDAPLPTPNKSALRTGEQHAGFDNNTGDSWLYPNNLPQRAYQLSIVQAALYRNTLVVLPTGLGKTFIAAVLMYNMYRWYPTGKIIFMAPTRPLVAQQIEACQRVMPFASEDTVELTGKLPRSKRVDLWQHKRVFFVTPQVVQSDMACSSGEDAPSTSRASTNNNNADFPFASIKLIVVDEAHRARGRYAYTEVVQSIAQRNRYFRVLALSATPGRTMEDVAEVVRNLLISHLEVRWDSSIDVLPYVHKRNMKTVVVPLSERITTIRTELLEIIDPYLRQLVDANVLSGSLTNINKNFLLFEQKRYRENARQQRHPQHSAVSSNFSICISLYHALELLERHGLRVFLNNFEEDEEGRAKFVVNMDRRLRSMLERLREQLGPNPFDVSTHAMTNGEIAKLPDDLDFGHPKFEHARSCLLEHFQVHPDSRAIVFCEYRESVMLIYRLLLQQLPLLKPRCFVGQGGSTGSLRPLTQKEQIQIMKDFRAGKNNILVATCIGEEGIDVGEVELIVCFDISTSNPQRFVQRIGRTGRQKAGNVVMLVTEGREQQILKGVLAQKDQTNKKLLHSTVVQGALYKHSPRLVPTEFNPKVLHTYIKPPKSAPSLPATESKAALAKSAKTKKPNTMKSKPKASEPLKGSQDLRNFFKKPSELGKPTSSFDATQSTQPGTQTQRNIEQGRRKIDDYFKDFEAPLSTNTQMTEEAKDAKEAKDPNESSETIRLPDLEEFLRSTSPLLLPEDYITDTVEQIKSDKVSDEGKRFILRAEPNIVTDVLEKMRVIETLEADTQAMSEEEKDVRRLYGIVEQLLGGTRAAVERFLDDIEIRRNSYVRNDELDMSDGEFETVCDAIFEGLEDQGPDYDNFEYIMQEFEKTPYFQDLMAEEEKLQQQQSATAKDAAESMVYETIALEDDDELIGDANENDTSNVSVSNSKHHTQCRWDDFANDARPMSKSTPLQKPLSKEDEMQQLREIHRQGMDIFRRLMEGEILSTQLSDDDEQDVIFVPQTMEPEESVRRQNSGKKAANIGSDSAPRTKPPVVAPSKKEQTPAARVERTASAERIQNELDFDLQAFMEPFPEENVDNLTDATMQPKVADLVLEPKQNAVKVETEHLSGKVDAAGVDDSTSSAIDITAEITASTSKLLIGRMPQNDYSSSALSPSQKENLCTSNPKLLATPASARAKTPEPRSPTPMAVKCRTPETLKSASSALQQDKSPSVFDMYLKNTRGRGKLLSATRSNLSLIGAKRTNVVGRLFSTPATGAKAALTSLALAQRPGKRVLHLSSDSSELDERQRSKESAAQHESETECEEIAETQLPKRCLQQQRKKRRRLNDFIDAEACASGSDESADEFDGTSSQVVNSLLASSDESTDVDAPSATQMQAHYLQSIKSPQQRAGGAFKIPNFRVFNDQADVYSQPAPLEPSQYELGSFIVSEMDARPETSNVDRTLSPLTRAERILKQRRRVRKKFKEVATVQRGRRVCQLADSSDEE